MKQIEVLGKFKPHHDDLYSVCDMPGHEQNYFKIPHIFTSGSQPLKNNQNI